MYYVKGDDANFVIHIIHTQSRAHRDETNTINKTHMTKITRNKSGNRIETALKRYHCV